MSTITYKCSACKREIQKLENTKGLTVFSKCIITDGCRGKLRKISRDESNIREFFPAPESGLTDYQPRRGFYEHTQSISSRVWNIVHGLSVSPEVTVWEESNGAYLEIDQDSYTVKNTSINEISITFNSSIKGIAHCLAKTTVPVSPKLLSPEVLPEQTTENGYIIFAVPEIITDTQDPLHCPAPFFTSINPLRVMVEITKPNEEPVTCPETIDGDLFRTSWANWDRSLIRNRRHYTLKAKKLIDFRSFSDIRTANEEIPDGTIVRFLGVDYGDGACAAANFIGESSTGDEALSNGSFTTDLGWDQRDGWVIDTFQGLAISDGSQTSESALLQSSDLNPDLEEAIVPGTTYIVEYTIAEYVSGSIRVGISGGRSPFRSTTGTFFETVVAGNSPFGKFVAFVATEDFVGSIKNLSVRPLIPLIAPSLGNQLLRNGSFTSELGWEQRDGWSIDTTQRLAISDGSQTSESSLLQFSTLNDDLESIIPGSTYIVEYTIADYTSGSIRVGISGGRSPFRSAPGTYAETIVAGNSSFGKFVAFVATEDFVGSITNLSLRAVIPGATIPISDQFRPISSRGLFVLLSQEPFESVDKIRDKLIDTGEMLGTESDFFVFSGGDLFTSTDNIENTYPDIKRAPPSIICLLDGSQWATRNYIEEFFLDEDDWAGADLIASTGTETLPYSYLEIRSNGTYLFPADYSDEPNFVFTDIWSTDALRTNGENFQVKWEFDPTFDYPDLELQQAEFGFAPPIPENAWVNIGSNLLWRLQFTPETINSNEENVQLIVTIRDPNIDGCEYSRVVRMQIQQSLDS